MYDALDNCLFVKDQEKFEQLREKADAFNRNFNGSNIIQDDIFHIVENYTKKKNEPLELLRYPIDAEELCACTFLRGGRIFVLVNSQMPLAKQIFAAGHELYHVWCYLENDDPQLVQNGSMLDAMTMDDTTTAQEEMEANAFSGLLLVPAETLYQQIRIYGINLMKISLIDILMLMEIFAVPYKAIVLRLYEDGLINDMQVKALFSISSDEVTHQIRLSGKAKRWMRIPQGVEQFGSLEENMAVNEENMVLQPSRLSSDKRRLQEIREKYHLD